MSFFHLCASSLSFPTCQSFSQEGSIQLLELSIILQLILSLKSFPVSTTSSIPNYSPSICLLLCWGKLLYSTLYIYSVCYWCASILIKLALIFFATSFIPLLCDKNSNDAIINFKISPFSSSGELNKENFIFSFPFIFFHICPSSHLCYQLVRASTKKNCQVSKHPSTSIPVEVVPYLYHIVYF